MSKSDVKDGNRNQQDEEQHEKWRRLKPFMRDGVEVRITPYAHSDHSSATTVFTSQGSSETFHADKHCHRLHASEPSTIDGKTFTYIYAHMLEKVMTSWLNPVKPCDYCTQDIQKTAEIAVEQDGVPEECLQYYEPGDKRVTSYSRAADGTMKLVKESSSEVY